MKPDKKNKIFFIVMLSALLYLLILISIIVLPRLYIKKIVDDLSDESEIPKRFELNEMYQGDYVTFNDIGISLNLPVYDDNIEIHEIDRVEGYSNDFAGDNDEDNKYYSIFYRGNGLTIRLLREEHYDLYKYDFIRSLESYGAKSYEEHQYLLAERSFSNTSYFKPFPLLYRDVINLAQLSIFFSNNYTTHQNDKYSFIITSMQDFKTIDIEICEYNSEFKLLAGITLIQNDKQKSFTHEEILFILDSIIIEEFE